MHFELVGVGEGEHGEEACSPAGAHRVGSVLVADDFRRVVFGDGDRCDRCGCHVGDAGGGEVDVGRSGRRGSRECAPADDFHCGAGVDVTRHDAGHVDRHRLIRGVDLVAQVQLDEQHLAALVEAGRLDSGQLSQLELEVVE